MNKTTKYLCALLMAVAAANVHAIPISDLFNGASISSGDKQFDSWILIDQLDPIAGPMDLGLIEVTSVGDGSVGNEYGLSFSSNGQWSAVGDDFLSFWFGFSATVINNPTMRITGATMTGTVATQGDGHLVDVLKDVFESNQVNSLAALEIYSDPFDVPALVLEDAASFAGQDSIWVEDYIFVDGDGGSAELVNFQQRFVQSAVADVPEPASLPLFALGLMGYVLVRRRQHGSI